MSLAFREPRSPQEAFERARAAAAIVAYHDPAAFNSLVLRDDEEPDLPLENAPMHEGWQSLISEHQRLAIVAHVEAGKTAAVSIGRVLWELGHNPNLRICILSETDDKASEIVQTLAKYIEESVELHMVFPRLRPGRRGATEKSGGRDSKWTMHRLTVERTSFARDPSVRACGSHGTVQGARIDLLIVDDIVTIRNSRTAAQRKNLAAWFKQSMAGRLTRRSRVIFLNQAYHPKDLVHEYAKRPGYVTKRFPIRDPATGEPTWKRFTREDIEKKEVDLGGPGTPEAKRQLDCVALDEGSVSFEEAWIERALKAGEGLNLLHSLNLDELPEGAFTTSGFDQGFGTALCSIVTLITYTKAVPAWGIPAGARQLIAIESGHWSGPDMIKMCWRHHLRFGSIIFVEAVAAQRLILDFMPGGESSPTWNGDPDMPSRPFPVHPFQTGANKWSPRDGVAAIGIEMSQGLWILPNHVGIVPREVGELIGEIMSFSADDHTGDRLMALWIAKEGARRAETFAHGGEVTVREL